MESIEPSPSESVLLLVKAVFLCIYAILFYPEDIFEEVVGDMNGRVAIVMPGRLSKCAHRTEWGFDFANLSKFSLKPQTVGSVTGLFSDFVKENVILTSSLSQLKFWSQFKPKHSFYAGISFSLCTK